MSERPTFYAVIPAYVRYADISAHAKLLFGELTALTEREGFCWASNAYFARLYRAGNRSVCRWLAELLAAGFIEIEPAVNQHGQRKVYLADAQPKVARQKWPAKNGVHNDTSKRTIQGKREARAQRLEAFLEDKALNGAGCPIVLWAWADHQLKWSTDRINSVFQTFSDYWKAQPGQKGIKADWEATWRNWCRREGQFQKPASLAKGEIRVRETTDAERSENALNQSMLKLLRQHPRKSEAEIAEMMNQGKQNA